MVVANKIYIYFITQILLIANSSFQQTVNSSYHRTNYIVSFLQIWILIMIATHRLEKNTFYKITFEY